MKLLACFFFAFVWHMPLFAQKVDTLKQAQLTEVVASASRVNESFLHSPISIEQLKSKASQLLGTSIFFDALQYLKEVQVISPSLGFKVLNTRGFANTTNVRFAQLVDGIDNQAPHIGAPIANAIGVTDLDIQKIEIISGTASALYGMNAVNGLANFITKNPFNNSMLGGVHIGGFYYTTLTYGL